MTSRRIERRIFVVGVPRSGTTLVQSLLASHSRLTSFTESHLFARHFRRLPGSSAALLVRDPSARLREFLAENGLDAAAADALVRRLRRRLPAPLLLPLGTGAVAGELLRALDEMALRRDRTSWIEKTPRHLRFAPFLERRSGRERPTRFVHVIRDGLEAVASLYTASRSWERPYSLASCVRRWNADVAFSLRRASRPGDHFVFYERLTTRPEATLKRLLAELGLAWEPGILDRFHETSRGLITPEESWKANLSRGLHRSATSGRTLTEPQRRWVERALRRGLYERLLARAAC